MAIAPSTQRVACGAPSTACGSSEWSISSVQWVSTFASGAPSLGRPRRLAGYPTESGPPSSQGKIRRELPSHI